MKLCLLSVLLCACWQREVWGRPWGREAVCTLCWTFISLLKKSSETPQVDTDLMLN